jgi:hypothetical protein
MDKDKLGRGVDGSCLFERLTLNSAGHFSICGRSQPIADGGSPLQKCSRDCILSDS